MPQKPASPVSGDRPHRTVNPSGYGGPGVADRPPMRLLHLVLLAALPATTFGCIGSDDGDDLGSIVSGKGDSSLIDTMITVPAKDDNGPGEKHFTVHASTDFDVALRYDGDAAAELSVKKAGT